MKRSMQSKRLLSLGLLALALGSSLPGCAPLVLGGAAVGGLVATDRRTSGAQLEDEGIELRAVNRLHELMGDRTHINANSYNRQVLLTGEVPSAADKQLAEQTVSKIENVRSIVNDLAVAGNTSLTSRSSDALITGRVKAALVDAKGIYANAFRVTTERSVVYLMGRVTQREATLAAETARTVPGVLKVVRVMEYITEEDLKNTLPQPAPAGAAAKPAGS